MKPRSFILGLAIVFACSIQAQVSVNVNIGARPAWGPVVEPSVRYYYLPDVEGYYDMHTAMFIYLHNGHWVHKRHLPGRYRHYDLYLGRKIIVRDYRGDAPYHYWQYREGRYDRGNKRFISGRSERYYDHHQKRHDRDDYQDNDRDHDRDHDRGNGKKKGWRD